MIDQMSHETAEQTQVLERYLMGESGVEEREAFEAHYFSCGVCADYVRTGSIFVDNARALMRETKSEYVRSSKKAPRAARSEWLNWFRPSLLVPSLAMLLLAITVGYQNFVTLPRLTQPQLLSATVIAPIARDGGASLAVDRRRPMFNVNFDVNAPAVYAGYVCTFRKAASDNVVLQMESGPKEVSSFTLGVLLPASRFPDGNYSMLLTPVNEPSNLIQRYNFTVRSGE